MQWMFLGMAFIAGSLLSTQAAVNSQLGKSLNDQPLMAAFVSFLVGTVLLFAITVAKGQHHRRPKSGRGQYAVVHHHRPIVGRFAHRQLRLLGHARQTNRLEQSLGLGHRHARHGGILLWQ